MLTFCWGFVFCFRRVAFSCCQKTAAPIKAIQKNPSWVLGWMTASKTVLYSFLFFFPELHFHIYFFCRKAWQRRTGVTMCRWVWGPDSCLCHVLRPVCLYVSKCVCAVCRGKWPPAADSVGADVGEVLWASESRPVVSEIQSPQGGASLGGLGNAAESPTSSVSDNTYISLPWEANCGSLRHKYWCEPVCCSPLPFSHFTFCCWACWLTPL